MGSDINQIADTEVPVNVFIFIFGIVVLSACSRAYSPVRRLPWAGLAHIRLREVR